MSTRLSILTSAVARPPAVEVPGLYVHIPFCFHKCHYCDFYSITGQSDGRMSRFVDLILTEARGWTLKDSPRPRPRTVFFGGGTPTLLPPDEMRRLLAGLRELFDCSICDEWTIEANPATVTGEYCHMLRENGVTRMSFGAQSFDRAELAMLERHHEPKDVAESVTMAQAAGIERLNVDLIYAICGQSLESWSRSLETAMALGTEHLSCYGLTFEPNTPLTMRKRQGLLRPVDEEIELGMLFHARRRLAAAGLAAYEISNYAAPGAECRHNILYWTGGDYLSLGPSAASHVQGWRWKNAANLGVWESAVENGESPARDVEHLAPIRRAGELAMLTLRLSRGIVYGEFDRLGIDARRIFAGTVERLAGMGYLSADERGARLTESGVKVADSLAEEFILDEE